MAETSKLSFNITDGPDSMALTASFFRKSSGPFNHNMAAATAVTFTGITEGGQEDEADIYTAINAMEREDGSGESFLISGMAVNKDGLSPVKFAGCYNTGTRKGRLTLFDS